MLFIGRNKIPVIATVKDIMLLLQKTLHINNIPLLKDLVMPKYDGQDIVFTCPFHKNGNENKPSAGIMTRPRDGKIMWHCFTCHEKGTLETLISRCFGYHGEDFGTKWILDHFSSVLVENRSNVIPIPTRNKAISKKEIKYVSEEELDSYRYICTYHRRRHLTEDIIEKYDIGYDANFKLGPAITFPVKDPKGNCLFVARRTIYKKNYNYPLGVDKSLLYGLYEANKYYPSSREIYICESMLNTLTLARWVFSVALLGTGIEAQYELIRRLPQRCVVLCLDNDEAGYRGENKLVEALSDCKIIKFMHPKDKTKDINDLGYIQDWDEFRNNCDIQSLMQRRNNWKN